MNDFISTVRRNDGREEAETAFIFSCPGQEEQKSGKLVNGRTGKNLDIMLSILYRHYPQIFPFCCRYDYRITNSSEKIHYKAFDNRTEPREAEITEPANIRRLINDISGYKYIITFGRCAALAADEIRKQGLMPDSVFLYSRHLSFLSLNSSIKYDTDGKKIEKGDPDSTYKRLEVAAKMITDQLIQISETKS